MKLGKSLLLGELLKAESVEYTDVSQNRFWIVCPACSEPVFKVVRNAETEKQALHYFSHYEADKAYAADCELRVGRITEREVQDMTIQSRDQKLKFFVSKLKDAVHAEFVNEINPKDSWFDNYLRSLSRSHTLADFRETVYRHFLKGVKTLSEDEIMAQLDYAIQQTGVNEQTRIMTKLSLETQKRIALDLLDHLTTPPARPTFDYLFDHAFTWLRIRAESNVARHPLSATYENDLLRVIHKLPQTSRTRGNALLADLQRKDFTKFRGIKIDGLHFLVESLVSEILRILIRLPYLQLLHNALRDKGSK